MKRALAICLIASLLLTSGCAPADEPTSEALSCDVSADVQSAPPTEDKKRPVITVDGTEIIVGRGESIDPLAGVTGTDDTDGDITHKITYDSGGYNPDVTGIYTVTYSLTDSAGNAAIKKKRTIIVREMYVMERPELWNGAIDGEKQKPQDPKVFGGAWYHKVVSSKDKWVGIEATVTLPEFEIERYDGDYDTTLSADPNVKNLDNPSVYLGGNAGSESDVGLSLSRALIDVKNQTLSTGSIVFRPFWRYITKQDQDLGGYDVHNGEYAVSANGSNCFANYHWRFTEFYYLPGDTLRMLVYSPEPNKLQLMIEVLEVSTLPSSVAMRDKYGWKQPANFISPVFTSPGHGTGADAEFKRVNAIDQSGNEGKTAIPTSTEVKNAVWHETYLYRTIDGKLYSVPMNDSRRGATDAPDADYFTVTQDGEKGDVGGEVVSIHPGYKN